MKANSMVCPNSLFLNVTFHVFLVLSLLWNRTKAAFV